MEYIPEFIARKHGRSPIQYDIPVMERYLKDTYGITVYQEQVMLLSRLLANFTRGESDELRKAMGKKIKEKLMALKPKFINGGKANGYSEEVLEKIWADWEKFASYAFNKSHATCYSLVAYQTAWLKAHFPSEYMAAVLSRSINNISDITKFMDECKAMGIQVLGPDLNESNLKFTVNKDGNIRFGLGAIKNVGENAVLAILEERKNGPFKDVYDFVERVNLNACNKKAIESMALAGCFDSLNHFSREQFVASNAKGESFLEQLIRYGSKWQADKLLQANTLFGGENEVEVLKPEAPKTENWPLLVKLNREKELVGMYLSSHPLDSFYVMMHYVCNTTTDDIKSGNMPLGKELLIGGIVTQVREKTNKRNELCGFVTLEDYAGSTEIAFWPKDYIEFGKFLKPSLFLFIRAIYQEKPWKQEEKELKVKSIELMSDAAEHIVEHITLSLPLSAIDKAFVENLYEEVGKYPGKSRLCFTVTDYNAEWPLMVRLSPRQLRVKPDRHLIDYFEQMEFADLKIND
jgi:DNA polymerase-3 subunit alpha